MSDAIPPGNDQDGPSSGDGVSVDEAFGDLEEDPVVSRQFEYEFEDRFSQRSVQAERDWVNLSGLSDHFSHKKKWSWVLLVVISWMVVFQSILIWEIGRGFLDFTKYAWLLPTVMIQYLAQVVGLAVFVVRSLFKDIRI